MNFTVKAEGLLPSSFYSKIDGVPYDRRSVDLAGECKVGETLSSRTHDIRLLTILTKLHALNRDAPQVARLVEQIAALLETYWEDVHPRAEQGDYSYRMACLQALDDNAHIGLPLQYSPILKHPRVGDITLRAIFVATGQVEPRDAERQIDPADIDRAMNELDLEDLRVARDLFERLGNAAARIRSTWLERAGYDQAVRFDLIAPLCTRARDVIAAYAAKRGPDPDVAASPAEAAANGAAVDPDPANGNAVATFADAENALSAAAEFFARNEPSNPALPLIRQAQQLMGKSFIDVLRILAPNHVETAYLNIGNLQFPVERLAAFSAIPDIAPSSEAPRTFCANSRQQAVSILARVNAFYAMHEPSSPLPLFTERACSLAGRSFLGIIKDVLPEEAMKLVEKNVV